MDDISGVVEFPNGEQWWISIGPRDSRDTVTVMQAWNPSPENVIRYYVTGVDNDEQAA